MLPDEGAAGVDTGLDGDADDDITSEDRFAVSGGVVNGGSRVVFVGSEVLPCS